ncbi:hypothetical protein [Methanobacterium sp. SMA-27]|uniref:hypothetical protein n=1 Tax=Methanobacterium sp. SMA-27 TaxID=1495336 RepID=UPI00064E8E08|nr:hypothetical protein [Methanobacterium sp. SMA-27]
MNPKKSGTLFIVLMIALIAFGTASAANVANVGTNLFDGLTISNLSLTSLSGQEQITAIGDPSFEPVYVTKRIVYNITNETPVTPINNTNNSSLSTNSGN